MRTRTSRFSRVIAALFLVVYLTGCHSWHTTTIARAQLTAASPVRVTLADGRQLTLDDASIRDDSITGVAGDLRTQLVASDVSIVEVREIDAGKTLGAIAVGLFVGPMLIMAIACAVSDGCG